MKFSTSASAMAAAALSIAGLSSAAPAPAKVARNNGGYSSTSTYYPSSSTYYPSSSTYYPSSSTYYPSTSTYYPSSSTYYPSTSTYSSSTPTYTPSSYPTATLYPEISSQYTVSTGAINYNTGKGLVYKSPTDNGADITTLVTFYIPDSYYGSDKTCELVFDLDWSSTASGSARADVFTSLAPATTDTTTWPHGNLRDQHVGRLIAYPGQAATWEATYQGPTFACSDAAGMYLAGEFVGVYDQDLITWTPGVDGPKIIAY